MQILNILRCGLHGDRSGSVARWPFGLFPGQVPTAAAASSGLGICVAVLALSVPLLAGGPAGAEEEFSCQQGLFGTQTCESDSGTTIKSRPDLFGNTNSVITRPDGATIRCRSQTGLFGTTRTVCD